MTFELRPFQETAVRELMESFSKARSTYEAAKVTSAIGLTATTGAGKTVIASTVIDALLFGSDTYDVDRDPKAIFLWMTDLPELNVQTRDKMMKASPRLEWDVLPIIENTFNAERLEPGHVYFLNTQLLSKAALLTKEGPTLKREFTFWDVIRNTIEDKDGRGHVLYLVVDEAHRGMTEGKDAAEATTIIQRFIKGYPEQSMPAVPVVWGISATPQRFLYMVEKTDRARFRWDVPADDVRQSGLIKERTEAEFAGEKQTDAMALFPEGVKTWWDATIAWQAYHDEFAQSEALIVPALIVQVENVGNGAVTQTDLAALIKTINDLTGPLPADSFVHAFGEHMPIPIGDRTIRYLEPSKIATDPDARVVFFKDALGTGWDCPRAEVLFSFRRAVDPTSIGQMIGRMVRTPLARSITENDALNACYVFLPHYDRNAVKSIVNYLNISGNVAIAATIEVRSASVPLPRRTGQDAVVAAIEKVPTYVVPVTPARSALRFLAKMARFLSSSGIDLDAKQREATDGAELLYQQQTALAKDAAFQKEVDEQGEILTEKARALAGEGEITWSPGRKLQATEQTIDREFAEARRKLTPEVADAYVLRRINSGTPVSIRQAKLEARAVASRSGVTAKLEKWGLGRIDALRQQNGAAIEKLPATQRARYFEAILQQAPDPTPHEMSLPGMAVFRRGPDSVPGHVYAEAESEPQLAFGSAWERDTLIKAMDQPGARAWLRNVDRAPWSLRIPRREGNEWRPFYPDFLIVREDDERLVVDILDPHDHTKLDAVSKAKGLSDYARRNAEKIGHVDLIANVDGKHYRVLHLEREAIRKQIDALPDQGNKELKALYEREG